MTPLIVFLIMVVLFVILSPGIIINFPPIDNNWSDKSSYISTGETTLVNAIVHAILYCIIVMAVMGLLLPYSNFYAPTHMYHRYKELYGPRSARNVSKQLKNMGQPSALSGMPHQQTTFWSKIFGKTPQMMSSLGPTNPYTGKPIRTHDCPNTYQGSLSPMNPMMMNPMMMMGNTNGMPNTPVSPRGF